MDRILQSSALNAFSKMNSLQNSFAKFDNLVKQLNYQNRLPSILQYHTKISAMFNAVKLMDRHSSLFQFDLASKIQNSMSKHVAYSAVAEKLNVFKPSHFRATYNEQLERILTIQEKFSKTQTALTYIARTQTLACQLASSSNMYELLVSNVAFNAAVVDDEETLNFVEEVANSVQTATEQMYEKGYVTKEDLIAIKDNILDYLRSASKEDWQWFMGIIITIFIGFLPFYVTSNSESAKQINVATKDDIARYKDEIISHYFEVSKQKGIDKKLCANVVLRVKPYKKSHAIRNVAKGTVVTVLNISADWAYISYIDDTEGLPVCGWISTRFFCKPYFSKSFISRKTNTRMRK